MILYIQTPSIPRSELHNQLVRTMVKYLDGCEQFSEIRWFVNIDVITTSTTKKGDFIWEDFSVTEQNFTNISKELIKTSLNINISPTPCFYLAFRNLTLSVLEDIKKSNLKTSEYCVMWLEDDWSFIDEEKFNKNLDIFLGSEQYKCYILHRNKINMGGNPDIIKGEVFQQFKFISLNIDNKRDPENIRKFDVYEPYIFKKDIEEKHKCNFKKHLGNINDKLNHSIRPLLKSVLSSNVVEGENGDKFRIGNDINKNWNQNDKNGIESSKSYTYQ
tara:strand:+ start:1517 stop:2338 length:822 start_codon:yes stop_codon:yes gene_type:complete